MSTITKQAVQAVADLKAGYTLGHADVAILNELARIALASLEAEKIAEPVAKVETVGVCWYADNGVPRKPAVGTELYSAPPAPVSVPDDEQCKPHPVMAVKGELGFLDHFDRIISERDEDIDIGQLGISNYEALMLAALDAFRAAMLQGAEHVSNRDELPEGWVACSERMPDENAEQEVLACFKGGDISTLYYFEGRWDDAYGIVPIRQDVTHWMPLPAAPQQEDE